MAGEAGVAVQTVYAAFGNKRSVLWALLETSVAGDDEQATLLERVKDETADVADPAARLDRVQRFGRQVVERSVDVHRIVRGAAATDKDMRVVLEEIERLRYEDVRAFVELVDGGMLDPRDLDQTADVFFAITSYEMYELLVEQRGWSATQWHRWVYETLLPTFTRDQPARPR